MKELIDAVGIDEGLKRREDMTRYDASALMEACGRLLIGEDGFVRPCHSSVKDFLLRIAPIDSPK